MTCSAAEAFDAVLDYERYPSVFPFVAAVRTLRRAHDHAVAEVRVGRGRLSYGFTCRVDFERPHRIDVTLVDGPFAALRVQWRFEALADGRARVRYHAHSQFRARVVEALAELVFAHELERTVALFERRLLPRGRVVR